MLEEFFEAVVFKPINAVYRAADKFSDIVEKSSAISRATTMLGLILTFGYLGAKNNTSAEPQRTEAVAPAGDNNTQALRWAFNTNENNINVLREGLKNTSDQRLLQRRLEQCQKLENLLIAIEYAAKEQSSTLPENFASALNQFIEKANRDIESHTAIISEQEYRSQEEFSPAVPSNFSVGSFSVELNPAKFVGTATGTVYKGVRPTIKFSHEVSDVEIANAKGLVIKYAQSLNYQRLESDPMLVGIPTKFVMTKADFLKLEQLGVNNLPELTSFINNYINTHQAVPVTAINAAIINAPRQPAVGN